MWSVRSGNFLVRAVDAQLFASLIGQSSASCQRGSPPSENSEMESQIDQHGDQSAPRLEFVFQIRIELGERVIFGPLARGGKQGFVPVQGGEITGPRLQGRVLPGTGG